MRRVVTGGLVAALVLVVLAGLLLARPHHSSPVQAARPGARDLMTRVFHTAGALTGARLESVTPAETDGLISTSWHLEAVDGADLEITFGHGSCETDRGADVRESSTQVLIGHYVRDNSHGRVCTSILLVGRGIVHLAQPLGDRTLRHVAVNRHR